MFIFFMGLIIGIAVGIVAGLIFAHHPNIGFLVVDESDTYEPRPHLFLELEKDLDTLNKSKKVILKVKKKNYFKE